MNKLRRQAAAETGGDGTDFFLVRARMAMLRKEWKQAEAVLLEQGRVSEAVAMYTDLYRCVLPGVKSLLRIAMLCR